MLAHRDQQALLKAKLDSLELAKSQREKYNFVEKVVNDFNDHVKSGEFDRAVHYETKSIQ